MIMLNFINIHPEESHMWSNSTSLLMNIPPLKTHFRKANAHQFSQFRASVDVPEINIRVTFNLLLSSLHFQYFMPISFIQEYINQTAPWLPQAFIQSKKCNQSSHFSIFRLLNLYLLKINPVLAHV